MTRFLRVWVAWWKWVFTLMVGLRMGFLGSIWLITPLVYPINFWILVLLTMISKMSFGFLNCFSTPKKSIQLKKSISPPNILISCNIAQFYENTITNTLTKLFGHMLPFIVCNYHFTLSKFSYNSYLKILKFKLWTKSKNRLTIAKHFLGTISGHYKGYLYIMMEGLVNENTKLNICQRSPTIASSSTI